MLSVLFIIGGNLNEEIYHHILVNRFIPAVMNVEGLNINSPWFQQDGAPPYHAVDVQCVIF